ncbi:hypothetical protein O1611_g10335 [Lasiodiplodia mahajangana]|uniref:Uncharacterized protein n=1 Tax=Lasiodiplodia mahajangana TaxID=1108764 RepID=A0ACC2IZG8_9PEZI|nr:hypothetical protein O1611_g10335 [Lasiodiplodia mahajangana]
MVTVESEVEEVGSESPALEDVVYDLPGILNSDDNREVDDGGDDDCDSWCGDCSGDERELVVVGVMGGLLELGCDDGDDDDDDDDVIVSVGGGCVDGDGDGDAEDPRRASKPLRTLLSI